MELSFLFFFRWLLGGELHVRIVETGSGEICTDALANHALQKLHNAISLIKHVRVSQMPAGNPSKPFMDQYTFQSLPAICLLLLNHHSCAYLTDTYRSGYGRPHALS